MNLHGPAFTPARLVCGAWLICMLSISWPLRAENTLNFSTGERPPYIGANLADGGYVAELLVEIYRRAGWHVHLHYATWARARLQGGQADMHGMITSDNTDTSDFVYSQGFFGGTTALLKKRNLPLTYPPESVAQPAALFKSFAKYRVGVVRDGVSLPALQEAHNLQKEVFVSDLQSLDMLMQDRVQLLLLDQYSAADVMASQRPNFIGQLEFLSPPLAQSSFYLAFSKRDKNHLAMLKLFNEGLAQVQSDGTLAKIMHKHGLYLASATPSSKVKLTIGTVNNSDMLLMQGLAKEYEKQNPAVELDWRVMDENTLRRRLLSDFAIADGQFDVMTIGTYELPIWVQRGWLAPIKNLPKSYAVEDLLPTVRKHLSKDGQLYALPFYAESVMTYYRKDLFAKAGLAMPAQPSYAEILAFATKLHQPAQGVYGICLRGKAGWGENMAFVTMMVHDHGGRWFDPTWQPELLGQGWQQAVGLYAELLGKYGPPNADKNGFNENLKLFSNGQCAMWIDATVAAGMLFDAKRSKVSAQLGFAAAPTHGKLLGSNWLWSWALAIPHSSKHQAQAEHFISWATSPTYVHNVANSEGWVAVPPGTRKSTYANANYLKAAPFAQFVLNAIQHADGVAGSQSSAKPYLPLQYVSIPEYQAIGDNTGLEIAKVLRREQTVELALRRAQNFATVQMFNAKQNK